MEERKVRSLLPNHRRSSRYVAPLSPGIFFAAYHCRKNTYAGYILFILSLAFAKFSTGSLIRNLTPSPAFGRLIFIYHGLVFLWAGIAIVITLFQCSLPRPWDYINGHCINRVAFMVYVDALSMVTDAILMTIAIAVLFPVKMPRRRKVGAISCFTSRLL